MAISLFVQSFTDTYSLSLREVRSAGINIYNYYPDANGNNRGQYLSDAVVWTPHLKITNFPSNTWSSNDEPKRYRFGLVRSYYRNAFCSSSFITEKETLYEQCIYAADQDFLSSTIIGGNYPDRPDSGVNPYTFGYYSNTLADKIVINLIKGVTATLTVRYIYLPAYFGFYL